MIPSKSRADFKMCCTSASFAADPLDRIESNSAKPMMALSGARSFWFRSARKARSLGEGSSETSGKGEGDSFITFIFTSTNSRLRSRGGPNFRLRFHFHPQTGRLFETEVAELLHHLEVAAHFVFVGAENQRRLVGDQVGLVSVQERLVEAMPPHRVPGLDDFLER